VGGWEGERKERRESQRGDGGEDGGEVWGGDGVRLGREWAA
jgi:hypothetical protein